MTSVTLFLFNMFFMLGIGMLTVIMCAVFLSMMDSFITGGRVSQKIHQYISRKFGKS